MTNQQIILLESIDLMNKGIINGSGIIGEVKYKDGSTKAIELPEVIHTFAAWKECGRVVRKGEKAKAAFTIWKHVTKKTKDDDGNEETQGRMFMKKAFFFTYDQTEEYKPKTARA